jgi:hypothetical protein
LTLEFDGYALIWWEQMLNDREEAGQGEVHSWPKMKREMSEVCPQTLLSCSI